MYLALAMSEHCLNVTTTGIISHTTLVMPTSFATIMVSIYIISITVSFQCLNVISYFPEEGKKSIYLERITSLAEDER